MRHRFWSVSWVFVSIYGGLFAGTTSIDRAPKITPEEIASRIKQVKPAGAMNWTKIPWTGSLLDAREASQQEKCPVFLFSLDGNISTGRC
jgi:hypothetical protein